jgi:hypothetical protein
MQLFPYKFAGIAKVTLTLLTASCAFAQAPLSFEGIAVIVAPEGYADLRGRAELRFGSVSRDDPKARSVRGQAYYVVSRFVNVRMAKASGERGHASVVAYLSHVCSSCEVRVDGIALGVAPQTISIGAPLNTDIRHRVDLVIPNSAQPGNVDAEISWQAEER